MTHITVGTSKTVHAGRTVMGRLVAACGAGDVYDGQIRARRSRVSLTLEPITCKRCLARMAAAEAIRLAAEAK